MCLPCGLLDGAQRAALLRARVAIIERFNRGIARAMPVLGMFHSDTSV